MNVRSVKKLKEEVFNEFVDIVVDGLPRNVGCFTAVKGTIEEALCA
ncbi:hypothetical protein ABIA69_002926 [Lysinibacillus parviboronicapiens]|uniref:Uncharacterized protein n=1 Tax=Lysinibacillus parviboronicapiens TaxID=436516 RepID=A0ABV2PLX4_9BACI